MSIKKSGLDVEINPGGAVTLALVLGDTDPRGAEQAVVKEVTDINNLDDEAGALAGAGGFEHDFVVIRVKGFVRRVDFADSVLLERFLHFALCGFDAVDEAFKARFGGQCIGRNGREGAL